MRRVLIVLVSVVCLAGCSSGSGSDAGADPGSTGPNNSASSPAQPTGSSTTQPPTSPGCDEIWQEGAILPADYLDCSDGQQLGEADVIDCQDGSRLITYANEFFARPGEKIIRPVDAPIQDTEQYSAAYSACTGE